MRNLFDHLIILKQEWPIEKRHKSYESMAVVFCRSICVWELANMCGLTLKAPITTAAEDIHVYFFIVFQRK